MVKLIKLDIDPKIEVAEKIESFLNPDYIYIPLPPSKKDVKKSLKIKKYDHLYANFYAPISGTLKNVSVAKLPSGKDVNCLVYENDFQEKRQIETKIRKKINNLTKEEVLNSIYDAKILAKLNSCPRIFLISGIDDEPYILNEAYLQREFTKQIVDTVALLTSIYNGSKAYIVLKNTDSITITAYQNIIGMYDNINLKLVDDYFLIGKEPFLKEYLHLKNNVVYFKTSDIYALYLSLQKRIPLVEKYITISGNGIKKPLVIKTKMGVKVVDIFNKYFNEFNGDVVFYTNGMMQGKELDISELIVTPELEGIIVMKREKRRPEKCIKCGKCISICPIKMNPLLAYKLGLKINCLRCGLCTYICPSYIPLQKYLSGDDDE